MGSGHCSKEGPRAQQSWPDAVRLAIFFLPGIAFLFPQIAACQLTADLSGAAVSDRGAAPGSTVTIRLETETGEPVAQTPAHTDGRFELSGLRHGHYRLTATAEGYEPYQQDIDMSLGASHYNVRITLTPLKKAREDSSSAPALTDTQAPKEARKEYEKGAHALAARKLDEARAHLEKAVAEFPCYARAQTDLATVLTEQHKLPDAEGALRKAVQCDPGFPDAYTLLGQLLNAEKKFAESADLLQEGVRRSPGAWQFYYQLAIAHFGLKKYNLAEEECLKVQSLNPTPPPEVHVKLADVYLKENAYDKAYAEMQAYLRADPQGRFAAKIKTIMQQMESSGALRTSPTQNAQPPPG